MDDDVDFAAEGLLDGLEGAARDGRLALLRELYDAGATLEELRRAVAERRLALLPVERLLGGDVRYSAREVAELAGVDVDVLVAALAAFGLPASPPDERRFGEGDVAQARRLRASVDAGLAPQRIIDANRVMGRAMAQVASALRQLVAESYLQAGDTEDELATRYAEATRVLLPVLAPSLEYAFALHLRERLRGDAIDAQALLTGAIAGAGELTVAFADLVGFTWLGGQVPADELGRVARRLEVLAAEHARPPVRLVKSIGDAVMLVSPQPGPLLETVLALVTAAGAEQEGFPALRAGVARGEARERDGDVYGQAVNLASRLTAIARPGSVVTDEHVREALRERFDWSYMGERRIKGLAGERRLFRARAAPAQADADP